MSPAASSIDSFDISLRWWWRRFFGKCVFTSQSWQ